MWFPKVRGILRHANTTADAAGGGIWNREWASESQQQRFVAPEDGTREEKREEPQKVTSLTTQDLNFIEVQNLLGRRPSIGTPRAAQKGIVVLSAVPFKGPCRSMPKVVSPSSISDLRVSS